MKHQIKRALRSSWARVLYHTGLFRVVDRCMPRRMLILAGHCVEDSECNAELPADMKLSVRKVTELLGVLGRHFDLCTIGDGVRTLSHSQHRGRSMVALSMDDGYRDNHRTLLPLLQTLGASATVFLESRPLDERRVNWSHKYFWMLQERDARTLAGELIAASQNAVLCAGIERALGMDGDLAYQVKRVLKYEVDARERNTLIDRLFEQHGGDESALCEQLYMTWEEARELQAGGVELGGHTVQHEVLSTLSAAEAHAEIADGRAALERELGAPALFSFAYPFGRHWDYNAASVDAVRGVGFQVAVTTHAGVMTQASDPMRLPRWMLEESTPVHLLVAEACGGFELLRKFGLDLSE